MAKKLGKFVRKVIGRKMLPPKWIKFGTLQKIDGTIKLQRICRAYSVPFEPIKVYKYGEKPLAGDIRGADRIIVRVPSTRWEYTTKNASTERLEEIAADIAHRTGLPREWKFIIQKVGLRENIESYGTIILHNQNDLNDTYYETPYKTDKSQKKSDGDFFVAHALIQPEHILKFDGNFLSQNSKKFVDENIGSQNAHEMMEYLKNKIKRGKYIILRFVKYEGEKKCFFYDMTSY